MDHHYPRDSLTLENKTEKLLATADVKQTNNLALTRAASLCRLRAAPADLGM